MIASRGIIFGRTITKLLQPRTIKAAQQQTSRLSHAWSYRTAAPPHSKATKYTAEIISTSMWWWILWHLWHEYEHITGEFYYPDPSDWTDAELGIPPDNYQE